MKEWWNKLTSMLSSDSVMSDFKQNIETKMAEANIANARMVGDLFNTSEMFLDNLYKTGYRDENGSKYDIAQAAVFVADTDKQENTEDSKAMPFMAVKMTDGSHRLLGLQTQSHNGPSEMGKLGARRIANEFRKKSEICGCEKLGGNHSSFSATPQAAPKDTLSTQAKP